MQILIAEDEPDIAKSYELAFLPRHRVTITKDGEQCVKAFEAAIGTPEEYDVVILDYRMPNMDGYDAAVKILDIDPHKRIIFASAYARETLAELVREKGIVAEILQKPFDLDILVNSVEDTELYEHLQQLKVNIGDLKSWNPSHAQLADLYDALLRLKDAKLIFEKLQEGMPGKELAGTAAKAGNTESQIAVRIIEDALNYLGQQWMVAFYYHLEGLGVKRDEIAAKPQEFSVALDKLLGAASRMIKLQIIKVLDTNEPVVAKSSVLRNFERTLLVATTQYTSKVAGGA